MSRHPWRRAATHAATHAAPRAVTALVVAATVVAGLAAIDPPAASATGLTAPGSIVYVLNDNVYVTTPTGSATVQVTTNGGTPTADATGDTGYSVPSESDGGLIVAARNQQMDKGKADEYTQGFLWEMDRSGHVVRKFKPAQFDYIGDGRCSNPAQQLPLGIFNAVVSPDGKHVAYTAQTYVQGPPPTCSTFEGYSSWIANVDGSGARMIADSGANTASLEVGHFSADSSRLLVDRADFGSVEAFTVAVGGSTAQHWFAPASDDDIDQAYQQADVRGSVLVTDGYSSWTGAPAVRLWTFSGFGNQPTAKCEWNSPVSKDVNEWLGRPSLAPDGSAVVFSDSNGAPDGAGEGIYLLSTSGMSSNCSGDQSLFIAHGTDPFWTPAGLYGPPVVNFPSPPAANTSSRSATIAFTAGDPDPAKHVTGYTCSLDGGAAQGCTSPLAVTGLADGVHHLTVAASDGSQSGSGVVSWRVDTQAPAAALTAPTTAALAGSAIRVAWSGSDAGSGVAGYQLRYQRAAYSGGFGAWTYPSAWQSLTGSAVTAGGLAAGYDYCWSVRALDRAGNAGAWSSVRCTAIALDDRSLSRSAGWTLSSGSAYYDRTVSTTTRLGATLTRTGATLARVGLVATTCSSCGQVAVYVGSTRIGVMNLHASGTHNRVLNLLPAFSPRSGPVVLKVLTSGRRVAVDGLVLARR